MIRYEVFGQPMGIERKSGQWVAYYLGDEGKHCVAHEVVIPPFLEETELPQYLADLCHEWATPTHPEVRRIV